VADYNWEFEVRKWLGQHRGDLARNTGATIDFFRLSFQNTKCANDSWFGCHSSGVSLVVGGIYLAAILRTGNDRGFWLVVDKSPPKIRGVEYRPVRSTQRAQNPLMWAHSESLVVMPDLVTSATLWTSFRSATGRVLSVSRSAAARDDVQRRRGKQRLSEFWGFNSSGVYPDESASEAALWEGAVRQVSVNIYERDSEARRSCIDHYGAVCSVCGINFGAAYGAVADGLIHVHHLRPLSESGGEHLVDPIQDLRPVCPNCHAVLHRRSPPYSIEDVRRMLDRPR
jgi:hypothetical protein